MSVAWMVSEMLIQIVVIVGAATAIYWWALILSGGV